MIHIGIDPGLSGAIAIIRSSQDILFYDTPCVTVKVGKSMKSQMDAAACRALLQGYVDQEPMVIIEKVSPMPSFNRDGVEERRTMGVTSAFNFGMGYGIWIGICAALLIPYQLVHPRTWKAELMRDMGKEKDASRIKAMQLFPWSAKNLMRKKDHGRADALLLAEWGRRNGGRVSGGENGKGIVAATLFEDHASNGLTVWKMLPSRRSKTRRWSTPKSVTSGSL